jgi:cytochrome c oxidase cbb3-type subunit 1
MITFGSIYALVPWMWKQKAMYSPRWSRHFWLACRNRHLRLRDVEFGHHPGPDVAHLQ